MTTGPRPQGLYEIALRLGDSVVTAGITPRVDGELQHVGRVGVELSVDEARDAARLAASNALSAVLTVVETLDAIEQVVKLVVYVNSTESFTQHSLIADAASSQMISSLGERGRGVRSAVGVTSLPGGAAVELEVTCAIRAV